MKRLILLPVAFFCCLLVACNATQGKAPVSFDLVAEKLPFPQPALAALEVLPGAPPLSEGAQKSLNLRRAFFARDFALLDQAVNELHERYVQGEAAVDEAGAFVKSIEETQLAGIDACRDWLTAMPVSYAAHWVCGAIWRQGAWVARSEKLASDVTPIRYTLMRERFQRSNELLEKAIGLSPKPVEAIALLASNLFVLGAGDSANALLQQGEAMLPTYGPVHGIRINYVLPQWGGSPEKVVAAIAAAKKAGVDEERLLHFHDEFVARPWEMSNPGAERDYWQRAIAEHSTASRLKSLTEYFQRVENWRDSIPVSSQWIELSPDNAEAYWRRAFGHEKLGNIPAALGDYRMAAALGHNRAIETLIRAHIQGGLGLAPKGWDALDEVCRYGAALGSAAAANCLGAMFWEGNSVGGPFHTDLPQAFAWHLFAARAGYHNSQYDLGWLMLTGRAPGVAAEQGKRHGLFWLRRAAELDHQFAKKKLQEGGYGESESVGEEDQSFERLVSIVRQILHYVL